MLSTRERELISNFISSAQLILADGKARKPRHIQKQRQQVNHYTEEQKQYCRDYYKKNRERYNEYMRQYCKKQKECGELVHKLTRGRRNMPEVADLL